MKPESTMRKSDGSRGDSVIVVCAPHTTPSIRPFPSGTDHVMKEIRRTVGGDLEVLPYPRQLGRGDLIVAANDGPEELEQNRWGVVGTFVVLREERGGSLRGVPKAVAEAVVLDLDASYGFLDPASGVRLACSNGVGLVSRRARLAPDFVRQGGKWNPQLHLTGLGTRCEATFLNWLLQRYARGIEALHIEQPAPGLYSIELQFGAACEDQQLLRECRAVYRAAYDSDGALKPCVAQRPPMVGGAGEAGAGSATAG